MAGVFPARILAILTPLPRQRVTDRYAIAIAAAALAIVLRWWLDPLLGHVAFYVTLYVTVTFCAIVCGFVPAMVSGILGFLGIVYWFVDPRHSLSLIRQPEIHAMIACFLVCGVLIALGEANRTKQMRLNETLRAVSTEARERQRAEEELRHAHDELEQRVQERTAALSLALSRLQSEGRMRQEKEDQLRSLSLHLMTLQDEERRRIARELHDTAGQTLAAMKMSIALIAQADGGNPELARLVDDLNALTDEALQEVRTASYLLHPPLLDEAGIASAARWFVEGFSRRSGIQVDCDIPEKMERPPRDCELVLFRVLQESLTNVHRHSGASAARVCLKRGTDRFELEVGDNGKGIPEDRLQRFNASMGTSGVGIAGMRERVRELGGRLEIRSVKNGTTISVALPAMRAPSLRESRATA
ncbi:MAG TPA: sensor histidine kinase [Candidatus Sulfotelmatobacter sp.]|nr:sensor histidine kinase [Candidatus Sulfotelmatobacter sp.]